MTQVGMETRKMGRLHFVVVSILRQTISTLIFASNFSSSGHCSHVCSFLTRDQNFEKLLETCCTYQLLNTFHPSL